MFYEKVVRYCEKEQISIMEFEKKCNIGNGTVGRWKDDGSKPSLHTLLKIESATGIPLECWTSSRIDGVLSDQNETA